MWVRRTPAALDGRLRRLTGFVEHADGPVHRREVPNGGVTLILGIDARIRISSGGGSGTFGSFVAGLHNIPVDTEHSGSYRCIQADLTPLGAYQLLGIPMSELTNTVAGTDTLAEPAWCELGERLTEAPSWDRRFQIIEQTLGARLADGPTADRAVHWAWRQLESSHGAVSISALADEIGWSRRHFAQRFRRQIGLAPKPAAQVLRFSHALQLLTRRPAETISSVAHDAGYADHSHLVRECRRIAGATPTELIAAYG